jgi:ornithine carbamoyltransferase
MKLISIADLTPADIHAIWARVGEPDTATGLNVAWSFEGNGIRTRSTFLRAFRELGMAVTELPNLLKTTERVVDLAGYLDPLFDLYVIRDSDHERLQALAQATDRPVIKAMSSQGHPCEVLTDAWWLSRQFGTLQGLCICLWGPTTNVFRSWHELAAVLNLRIVQVCERGFHLKGLPQVDFQSEAPQRADVVITDAWPSGVDASALALSATHLERMGTPTLLPTPPFTIGREIVLDPVTYPGFTGYAQKQWLLPVQKAILRHASGH